MKRTLLYIAILLVVFQVQAQKTFKDIASLEDKKADYRTHIWIPEEVDEVNGTGEAPNLKKKEIKKVALVAFTTYVPEVWKNFSKTTMKELGPDYFSKRFHKECIGGIQEMFKAQKIELLIPANMSAEQKETLKNGNKWIEAITKNEKDIKKCQSALIETKEESAKTGIQADGYINRTLYDKKPEEYMNMGFAGLAEALGVDAVLLICSELNPTKNVGYLNTFMTMIGKNPMPKPAGKEANNYQVGQYYSQTGFSIEMPVKFAFFEGKQIKTEEYDGLDIMMKQILNTMFQDIKKRSE